MAMLTYCFFCKKELIIHSAIEAYKIEASDIEKVDELRRYTKDNPYGLIYNYSCGECYRKKIFPHLFE